MARAGSQAANPGPTTPSADSTYRTTPASLTSLYGAQRLERLYLRLVQSGDAIDVHPFIQPRATERMGKRPPVNIPYMADAIVATAGEQRAIRMKRDEPHRVLVFAKCRDFLPGVPVP